MSRPLSDKNNPSLLEQQRRWGGPVLDPGPKTKPRTSSPACMGQKKDYDEETTRRAKAIRELEKLYLKSHAEDARDGTSFDCAVLDALDDVRDEFDLPKLPE